MVPQTVDDSIAAAFVAPPHATSGGGAPLPPPESPKKHPIDDRLGETNQNPPGMGLWALWKEDLRTHEGDLFAQGFWALAVHRFGNARMNIRPKLVRAPFSLLYKILYKFVEWTCGISLNYPVKVGRRVRIWHHGGMILGARSIGDDVHIRQKHDVRRRAARRSSLAQTDHRGARRHRLRRGHRRRNHGRPRQPDRRQRRRPQRHPAALRRRRACRRKLSRRSIRLRRGRERRPHRHRRHRS
jgi:hypothetical protein